MKVAIIGYGGRGHIYARYFQEDERVQIVAVCEKKPQKIKSFSFLITIIVENPKTHHYTIIISTSILHLSAAGCIL